MRTFIGIDLGSTTTKSVLIDENLAVLGRGITNSRSNYDVAARVSKQEAKIAARFTLFRNALGKDAEHLLSHLERNFRLEQFLSALRQLEETCMGYLDHPRFQGTKAALRQALDAVFRKIEVRGAEDLRPRRGAQVGLLPRHRGVALHEPRGSGEPRGGHPLRNDAEHLRQVDHRRGEPGRSRTRPWRPRCGTGSPARSPPPKGCGVDRDEALSALGKVLAIELEETYVVGTGYGRVRLPFPKEHIRSEILCHGLGAHMMFPGTRTVLDIGGQDTKGIQIDENGIVTSFQMNDRCAAGCGRYLGYIADEMKIGLHELGPIAMKATRVPRINSTCTVFAGAELRDRLALGEKREDILAGLHRAIMLRAISIISRSGGVTNEFTFTGGVAKNEAAVRELHKLLKENYGDMTVNISPDSIYTGALGGANFALRAVVH